MFLCLQHWFISDYNVCVLLFTVCFIRMNWANRESFSNFRLLQFIIRVVKYIYDHTIVEDVKEQPDDRYLYELFFSGCQTQRCVRVRTIKPEIRHALQTSLKKKK